MTMPTFLFAQQLEEHLSGLGQEELAQELQDFGFSDKARECRSGTLDAEKARSFLFICHDYMRGKQLAEEKHQKKQQKRFQWAERQYKIAAKAVSELMNEHSARLDANAESFDMLKQSIQTLKAVLGVNPDAWGAMFFIGSAYQLLGEDEDSYNWFMKAEVIEPGNTTILLQIGIQAAKIGKGEEAEKYMLAVLAAHPDNAGVKSNLALTLLIQGKIDEARRIIEEAVASNPKDDVNQYVLQTVMEVQAGRRECPDRIA